MQPMFNTRRIGAVPVIAVAAFAAGACASSGGGPVYELRPTEAPLTYVLSSEGGNEIETPGGVQESTFSGESVMILEIGDATDAGRTFTATIQSMSYETGGDFGGASDDLTDELGGKPFHGIIAADGDVTFTDSPDFQKDRMSTRDLESIVAGVLFPLPPGGDPSVGSWPHRVTLAPGRGLEGESVYEGTVTMVGDTVWNGIPASVMASEGIVMIAATGMPEGAPAEIELATEIQARTVYIWDSARGVLLEVRAVGEGGGDVSTMGFNMPMAVTSESLITLQR